MKEEDLRIGNIVLFDGREFPMTGGQFFGFGRTFKDGVDALSYFKITPKVIRSKDLREFGFVWNKKMQMFTYGSYLFEHRKSRLATSGFERIGIKYVHQLQNIFSTMLDIQLTKKPL